MKQMAKDWNDYQEEVADFFRTLGLAATTNATVEGVRGCHKVDVWVVSNRYGFEVNWLVECKFWQLAIPKEKVLALYQIAQDVGADRAFLLSESGFQSGAIKAAQNANVTLTSLLDLQSAAQEELFNVALSELAHKTASLDGKVQGFMFGEDGKPFPYVWIDREDLLDVAGSLLELKLSIPKAQSRKFPVYLAIGQSRTATKLDNLESYTIGANSSLVFITEAVAGFESATSDVQPRSRECCIKLIDAVRRLMTNAEDALFDTTGNEAQFEGLRRRSLGDMHEVGKVASEAKLVAFGQVRTQILLLMRLLIDSVYLHLTQTTIPKEDWDRSKAMVGSQLKEVNALISSMP